jgi:transposase
MPIFQGMELLSCLLPDPTGLRLVTWALDPTKPAIALTLISQQTAPSCPLCTVPAQRIHSHYERSLADLPWGVWTVRLVLDVRKLFCDNAGCARRIFTERLPAVVAPWARKTRRLGERLTAIAVALGGSAGARLSRDLGMPAARNTLLRLIRAAPLPPDATLTVLGVDDWAFRKRHRYGTVLIDLERRRRVTLLPDREADTLAKWLGDHPGVRIVARDRAGAYAEGAGRGAPKAEQVADRFHLVQNVAEVLETVFTAHAADLRAVEQESLEAGPEPAVRPAPPHRDAGRQAKAAERRERRLARYQQIWALHRDGWSGDAIARHLGIGHSTVGRALRHETFPERRGRSDAGRSLLDPWKPVILERWNAGCRHSRRLFREIRDQGYRGSYPTLARYTQRLRQAQEGAARRHPRRQRPLPPVSDPRQRPLTPRTAAWLVLRRAERDTVDADRLNRLRTRHAALSEAVTLAEEFVAFLRARDPGRLDPWLLRAQDSALPAFRNFARKLDSDLAAVRAAVTLPWSTGQVEGQINRLKMIKRQMFGRAGFDLLNRRFMLAA